MVARDQDIGKAIVVQVTRDRAMRVDRWALGAGGLRGIVKFKSISVADQVAAEPRDLFVVELATGSKVQVLETIAIEVSYRNSATDSL